jgi:hypothetical protein
MHFDMRHCKCWEISSQYFTFTAVQEEQPLIQNWVHYIDGSGKGTCGWQFNTYGSMIKPYSRVGRWVLSYQRCEQWDCLSLIGMDIVQLVEISYQQKK